MTWAVATIFVVTYLGMALGRVPGLALDRSGIAVVAAIAVVAIGALAPAHIAEAFHFPTLILLFALMIVSARIAASATPLLLFVGLFVVNRALADTGLARAGIGWLAAQGLGFDALRVMLPAALIASNTIGNVPAVIMLLAAEPRWPAGVLQALALTTTLAGNFFLVGSIANLIVAERAARAGVAFGFAAHLRAGVPLTLASMAPAAAWLLATGRVSW